MGHYKGMFNEQNLRELLDLLASIKGKFMLTMFPNELIKSRASKCGWAIQRIERTISAPRTATGRRRQEEWIVINYRIENQ